MSLTNKDALFQIEEKQKLAFETKNTFRRVLAKYNAKELHTDASK